jgi:hypothetical protein
MSLYRVLTLLTALWLAQAAGLVSAETPEQPERPRWSIEVKGGLFYPDEDDWSEFYGDDYTGYVGGAVAYKLLRQLELGVEGGYSWDSGEGALPQNQQTGGDVDIRLVPLNVFVLGRFVFKEDQLLVPYLGGGWTRMFYKQEVSGQDDIDGHEDGWHARGGLQLLLNRFEPGYARRSGDQYGLNNTYLFLEYMKLKVEDGGTDAELGGDVFTLGVLLEF